MLVLGCVGYIRKKVVLWDDWWAGRNFAGWNASIIEVWRGTVDVNTMVTQGYQVINAYGWYFNNAPEGCDSWQQCYEHDMFLWHYPGGMDVPIESHLKHLIIGGEGAAWELSEEKFNYRVWHRLVALSERLWTQPLWTTPVSPNIAVLNLR